MQTDKKKILGSKAEETVEASKYQMQINSMERKVKITILELTTMHIKKIILH